MNNATNNNNTSGTTTNNDDAYEKAQSELSSLNRVYHKLALTEAGESLQKVLSLLLPRLLSRIGSNHKLLLSSSKDKTTLVLKDIYNQIHLKLIDMISHIMKRSREDRYMKLPCISILELLYDDDDDKKIIKNNIDPFTLNLSLSFLTLGISRYNENNIEEKEELIDLLYGFLIVLGSYNGDVYYNDKMNKAKQTQFYQISHLVLRCIELLVNNTTTPTSNNTANTNTKTVPSSYLIIEEKMNTVRILCNTNSNISSALYNLLLDGLLYTNTTSSNTNTNTTTPSFGLSKNGYNRLQSGTIPSSSSTSHHNNITWKQEYASSLKLKQFKLHILDFITPTKKTWCIFFNSHNSIGIIRSILLLVIASGDDHLDVSNYAMDYLKIYIDNYKNYKPSSLSSSSEHDNNNKSNDYYYLGNPIVLTIYLLSLVIGETASNKILYDNKQYIDNNELFTAVKKDWMRRMVSDKIITTIFNFISLRILEEIPQYFSHEKKISIIIGNLLLSSSYYCFLNYSSSSNKIIVSIENSNNSIVGINPRMSYIQLLNLFTIQFTKLYDTLTTSEQQSNDNKVLVYNLKYILGKIVEISLSALLSTTSSSSSSSSNNNETNVRDACYGILCTLCRSSFVLCSEGTLFHGYCSNNNNLENKESSSLLEIVKVSSLSTTTTSQLFHCVMYEIESLRPRAIATLDALLNAYLKVYDVTTTAAADNVDNDITQTSFNPWANNNDTKTETTTNSSSSNNNNVEEEWKNVSKTLIPLLWNAASSSTSNKACKYASSRPRVVIFHRRSKRMPAANLLVLATSFKSSSFVTALPPPKSLQDRPITMFAKAPHAPNLARQSLLVVSSRSVSSILVKC